MVSSKNFRYVYAYQCLQIENIDKYSAYDLTSMPNETLKLCHHHKATKFNRALNEELIVKQRKIIIYNFMFVFLSLCRMDFPQCKL